MCILHGFLGKKKTSFCSKKIQLRCLWRGELVRIGLNRIAFKPLTHDERILFEARTSTNHDMIKA